MTESLRKIFENLVPWLMETKLHRTALSAVFWATTAFLALLYTIADPVLGAFVMGLPAVLLLVVRGRGIRRVSRLVLAPCLAAALEPATFLGQYQRSDEDLTGMVLFGFIVFVVWVGAYPVMVDVYDQLSLFPKGERPTSVPKEDRDPESLRRVLVVRLTMATAAVVVVGGTYVVALSVLGLLLRRRWTAGAALAACALSGFFSEETFTWTIDVLAIGAGLIAAEVWWQAYRNPLWDTRYRAVAA